MICIQYPYCTRDTIFLSAEAKEEITPDSSKSTRDQAKEIVTDTTVRLAASQERSLAGLRQDPAHPR